MATKEDDMEPKKSLDELVADFQKASAAESDAFGRLARLTEEKLQAQFKADAAEKARAVAGEALLSSLRAKAGG